MNPHLGAPNGSVEWVMSDEHVLLDTVLGGRYRIETVRSEATSAASAAGTIFCEGTDISTGNPVGMRLTEVARLIDPALGSTTAADAIEGFERQFNVAASLRHPTVEAVLDHGEAVIGGERHVYVVAEPLLGGSLRDMLDRGRRLTPSQALIVGIDVCRALDIAAKQGVVHGDLRPARLVFGLDRRVRVVGFGAPLRPANNMSVDQANYAAPELEQGIERSAASDVYSLALTLVEAMTGEVPFASDSVAGAFSNRSGKLLPVNADFGALAAVLERAGRPSPDERFSPREFGQALVQSAEKLPRPTPIDIVGSGLFDVAVAATDPSQPTVRPTFTAPPVSFAPPTAQPGSPILIRTTPNIPQAELPDGVVIGGSQTADGSPSGPIVIGAEGTGPTVVDADMLLALNAEDPTEQAPRPKKRRWGVRIVAAIVVLALLAGGGVVAWNTVLNPSNPVPELVGLTEGEARNQVSRYGWKVVIRKDRSDEVQTGQVIRTDPVLGSALRKRDSIIMYVSEGPTLSVLEDVTGLTADAAKQKLTDIGLVPEVTEAADETVAAGNVISWTVPDQPNLKVGEQLVKGATVKIVVSTGPAPRDVPVLIGLSLEEATTQLNALGLVIAEGPSAPSVDIPEGKIMAQLPLATTKLARGAAVLVSISQGQKTTLIPTVYGRTYDVVKERLEKEGLVVGSVTGNKSRGLKEARIKGKKVKDFERVLVGETVDLIFP